MCVEKLTKFRKSIETNLGSNKMDEDENNVTNGEVSRDEDEADNDSHEASASAMASGAATSAATLIDADIAAAVAYEEDDDVDLLDTIEVTVTTDGVPIPRDDADGMDISVSPGVSNVSDLVAAFAAARNALQANANTTINFNVPNSANAAGDAGSQPLVNLRDDLLNWDWDNISNDDQDDANNGSAAASPSAAGSHLVRAAELGSAAGSSDGFNPSNDNAGGCGGAVPGFFYDSSSFRSRTRKEIAALVNAECCGGGPTPQLDYIMNTFFNPSTAIDNPDNISWIRWLIAGGRTIREFVKIGKF